MVSRARELFARSGVLENGAAVRFIKAVRLLRVYAQRGVFPRQTVARHDARDARLAPGQYAHRRIAERGPPGFKPVDRVNGEQPPPGSPFAHEPCADCIPDVEKDDLIELRHAHLIAEDQLPQRLAPQAPVCAERAGKGRLQLLPQRRALFGGKQRVIQRVAVDDIPAAPLDLLQKRRLAAAGRAGDADDKHAHTSITWKPAAFFSRFATARPSPAVSGHWA